MDYKQSKHYLKHTEYERTGKNLSPDEMLRNNANNQPDYIFFAAGDQNLQYFVQALMGANNWSNNPTF
jgi:hypothetical protein